MTQEAVKQLGRAAYTVTNPLGAFENAVIDAALFPDREIPELAQSGPTYGHTSSKRESHYLIRGNPLSTTGHVRVHLPRGGNGRGCSAAVTARLHRISLRRRTRPPAHAAA